MTYGLYVHIPYCRQRCHYCDFYTRATRDGVPEAYIDALLRCFFAYAPKTPEGTPVQPYSVYFGGGTPSLLTPAQVRRLLCAVHPAPGAEVTLEANPESVNEEKLAGWLAAGVNRLSLGVQSARPQSLEMLGRLHTAQQAQLAMEYAVSAGFSNISMDIMLALPNYTQAEFDETLALGHAGGASHISAYLLKLEEGTPLAQNPPVTLPGPDAAAEFYLYAAEKLEAAGYARYEISNFARPGFESRHNLLYWDAGNWLGIGPAAHSSLGGNRFSFPADTAAFINATPQPQPQGTRDAAEYIMLRLRLAKGLDVAELQNRFGLTLSPFQLNFLHMLHQNGLAIQTAEGWALTGRGMLVQNSILARLLA